MFILICSFLYVHLGLGEYVLPSTSEYILQELIDLLRVRTTKVQKSCELFCDRQFHPEQPKM